MDDGTRAMSGESFEGAYADGTMVAATSSAAAIQTVTRRGHRELESIRRSDLVEEAREMMFDCLFADRTLTGDVLVRASRNDQAQDLTLPGCQGDWHRCAVQRMR